jgi:hypothetical protein
MTRRQFVAACLVFAAGVLALALAWPIRPFRRAVVRLLHPRLDARSLRGSLSPDEMRTVVAFAEVLVDPPQWSDVDRTVIRDHVQYRTERGAGYLALYRMTAQLLEDRAGGRFAEVDRAARTRLVVEHGFAPKPLAPVDYFIAFDRRVLAVRTLAAAGLLEGYYDSAAGWAVVGHRRAPGQCGDLLRYTAPEA